MVEEGGATEMLKLYDYPDCPFCQKVRVVLAEKDLEYEKIFVDLRSVHMRCLDQRILTAAKRRIGHASELAPGG